MSNLTDNSMDHLSYLPKQYLKPCQSQQLNETHPVSELIKLQLINYLINYRKSYFVQFGQTRVFLIAVYEHSKAAMGQLEKPRSGFPLWYQSNKMLESQ
jgi:hypothetical protein